MKKENKKKNTNQMTTTKIMRNKMKRKWKFPRMVFLVPILGGSIWAPGPTLFFKTLVQFFVKC